MTRLVYDTRYKRVHPVPLWEDGSGIKAVEREVRRRRKRGEDVTVGHIIPIQSRYVCGLHCTANLCIEPARDNYSKGNRVWPGWNEQLRMFMVPEQLRLF